MGAEEVVAGAHRDAHEPVLERRFEPEAGQPFETLEKHLLNDVLHLGLAAGIAAGGGEDARLMASDEDFKGLRPSRTERTKPLSDRGSAGTIEAPSSAECGGGSVQGVGPVAGA